MRARIERWRTHLTVELILFSLVVAVMLASYYQAQQTKPLQDQMATIESRLTNTQDALDRLNAEQPSVLLRQRIQELEASLTVQNPPTRREALALGSELMKQAASRGLRIAALNTSEGIQQETPEGQKTAFIRIQIEIEGPLADLIDNLNALEHFETATVESLQFTAGENGTWKSTLALLVVYQPSG